MKSKTLAIFVVFALPLLYFYDEIVATFLLALVSSGFAVSYALDSEKKKNLVPTKLLCGLGFLIVTWLLLGGRSVWLSCSFYSSWPFYVKLCSLVLLSYSIGLELSSNPNGYMDYCKISALQGFLQGLFAIVEYIEAPPIPATWLDPASKALFRTRCCGLMTDPNIFAAFLTGLFLLTIAYVMDSKGKAEKVFGAVSLLFCGAGIFMTLSRGGWVAWFAAIVVYLLSIFISKQKLDKKTVTILSLTATLLIVIFLVGPFKYRLFSMTKPSDMTFAQRTLINNGIFASLNKLPIWGHGLHTFTQVYPFYRIVGGDYPMNAHNEFLHSLIESGFLSSIILGLICLFLMRIIYRIAKKGKSYLFAFSASFIAFWVQNLTGFSTRILPTSAFIALAVGAILSSEIHESKKEFKSFSQIRLLNYSVLLLSLIAVVASINNYFTQNKLTKADILISEGNVKEASLMLRQVLESNPNHPMAAYKLGMICSLTKAEDKAIEIWKNAMETNGFEAIFPINIARLYADKVPEMAKSYYEYALELDPASENFRLEYAKFLLSRNNKAEAIKVLEKGLTFTPGFHHVYTGFKEMESLLSDLKN